MRILIVDDEPENVEALEACFRKSKIRYETINSIEDAAMRIRTRTQCPFSAVICDNHFCGPDAIYLTGSIYGVDFINIIKGREELLEKEHHEFIVEHFGRKYSRVKEAYADVPCIAFSGSAKTDRMNRPDLYQGIETVMKAPDEIRGTPCELEIVDILTDNGIELKPFNFARYKMENSLTCGVRSDSEADNL